MGGGGEITLYYLAVTSVYKRYSYVLFEVRVVAEETVFVTERGCVMCEVEEAVELGA